MSRARQSLWGVGLAMAIIAAWLCCLWSGVFLDHWSVVGLVAAPLLIGLQCWLSVGLFIVAHDCMHGSLAPGHPWINRLFGRLCLLLYAGFSFDHMRPKHWRHHADPGTKLDPDFAAEHPSAFWPWFWRFFWEYFGWSELGVLIIMIASYVLLFHAHPLNLLVFWGAPALMSAAQLFYFGTFLPHRHGEAAFADRHNARSNDFSWIVSLLTCFHFGYHQEHHVHPSVPWWALPRMRRPA